MTILGIDAGATWIKAGRFAGDSVALEESVRVRSDAAEGVEAYWRSIRDAIDRLGGGEAVGLAIPGTFSRDGSVLRYAANIPGLTIRDQAPVTIAQVLPSRLGTGNISADNDASCAGLAEWKFGVGGGKRTQSLLHVTWGTGIGTAWIVNGRSQYGWEGGHMPVTWSEAAATPCSCGSSFDLEAFCAVPQLVKATGLQPPALLEAARSGEEVSRQALDTAIRWLARGLHMMSVLVYPDAVTIGGGFMASDWLLEEVKKAVGEEASGYLGNTLRPEMIHRAQLDNDAGMIGAALIAKQKFLK